MKRTEVTLPAVIRRMVDRFRKEAQTPEAGKLLTAAFILLGLRFPKPLAERLFQGVQAMEESVTYQAIIEKGMEKGMEKGEARGRVEEARRLLLRQGRIRFGPPDEATQAALAAIADLERPNGGSSAVTKRSPTTRAAIDIVRHCRIPPAPTGSTLTSPSCCRCHAAASR